MAKNDLRLNDTPVEAVPEVAEYQEVRARYAAFRSANPEFFQYLDALQEELNQKMQAAEKVVRAREISCGDFELYQFQTKYSPEELLQALGRDKFLQVGGTMTTQTVYGVEKARLEAAIRCGDIPAEVAARVVIKSPRFHKPEPLVIL